MHGRMPAQLPDFQMDATPLSPPLIVTVRGPSLWAGGQVGSWKHGAGHHSPRRLVCLGSTVTPSFLGHRALTRTAEAGGGVQFRVMGLVGSAWTSPFLWPRS